MKVFITIDTEEDDWGVYRSTGSTTDNILLLPLLQDLFDRYGAVPTYLINYPVAQDSRARSLLSGFFEKGRCDLGTHCHPWNTPPFEEEIGESASMLCNLPYDLVMKKIETLHEAIRNSFFIEPRCFRAGRWGFGPGAAKAIHHLGYEVDTSVTPFVNWEKQDGPNFSKSPNDAYRFNPDDILSIQTDGPMLEVPPTIGFHQRATKLCSFFYRNILANPLAQWKIIGLLERMNILNFCWLSPELFDSREMIRLAQRHQTRTSFLNMSFHSTSLLPGKSPFVRNAEELGNFLKRIEEFLQFAANQGFIFAPLSDSLKLFPNKSKLLNPAPVS